MRDRKRVGSRQRSLSFLSFFSRRERPLLAGKLSTISTANAKEGKEGENSIYTHHPRNLAAKNIILRNFKLLQNDNETGNIFS